MKYTCVTCQINIDNNQPLTRPQFHMHYWCSVECLIEFDAWYRKKYNVKEYNGK